MVRRGRVVFKRESKCLCDGFTSNLVVNHGCGTYRCFSKGAGGKEGREEGGESERHYRSWLYKFDSGQRASPSPVAKTLL